jgi:hypothetical protein
LQVPEEMPPKIGHDTLRDPGGEIAMSHRAESLQDDQSKEKTDQLRHLRRVSLHRDDIP